MSSTVDEAVPAQESGVQSTPKKSRMILFISIAVVGLVLLGSLTALMFMKSDSQLEANTNLKDSQNLSNSKHSPNDPLKSPADNSIPANNLLIFGRTFQKPPVWYIIVCAVLFVLVVAGICALIAYKVYSAQLLQQQELLRQQQQDAATRASETAAPFNFFHQLFFKSSALPKLLIAFAVLCQVLLIALLSFPKLLENGKPQGNLFKYLCVSPLIEALLVSTLLTGVWQLGAFANLSVALFFQTPATYWLIAAASVWITSGLGLFFTNVYYPGQAKFRRFYNFVRSWIIPLTIGGLCAIGGLGAFFGVLALIVSVLSLRAVGCFRNREEMKPSQIWQLVLVVILNLAVLLYLIIGSLLFGQIIVVVPFILSLVASFISFYSMMPSF